MAESEGNVCRRGDGKRLYLNQDILGPGSGRPVAILCSGTDQEDIPFRRQPTPDGRLCRSTSLSAFSRPAMFVSTCSSSHGRHHEYLLPPWQRKFTVVLMYRSVKIVNCAYTFVLGASFRISSLKKQRSLTQFLALRF